MGLPSTPAELLTGIGQRSVVHLLIGPTYFLASGERKEVPPYKEFDAFAGARVLDLACGPGEWALEVSREFPELSVTGVDLSEQMIRYARAQAQARNLKTLFRIMDILQIPWEDFPDQSFDFINVRFITSLVPKHLLPALYHEC